MGRGLNFRRKVPPRGVPLHVLSGFPEFAVRYVEDFSLVGDVNRPALFPVKPGKGLRIEFLHLFYPGTQIHADERR